MPLAPPPFTVVITAATGTQGLALISALSAPPPSSHNPLPLTIRALVRDPSSAKAQALLSLDNTHTSILLVRADFADAASLARAFAAGEDGKPVDAVFLNTSPTFWDAEEEVRHAAAVLDAARGAGVGHAVYTSVAGIADAEVLSRIGRFPAWVSPSAAAMLGPADMPGVEATKLRSELLLEGENKIDDGPTRGFLRGYFGAKVMIEELVRSWGHPGGPTEPDGSARTWTVLRPAWFMTNFLAPARANYWPEYSPSRRVLRSAIPFDARMMLVDPADIGVVAARALLSPFGRDSTPSLVGKTVNIGSEALTLTEVARILTQISGVEVRFEHVDEGEAAREVRAGNVQRDAQAWHATLQNCFEPGELAGVLLREPRTFEEFLTARREEVKTCIGGSGEAL